MPIVYWALRSGSRVATPFLDILHERPAHLTR